MELRLPRYKFNSAEDGKHSSRFYHVFVCLFISFCPYNTSKNGQIERRTRSTVIKSKQNCIFIAFFRPIRTLLNQLKLTDAATVQTNGASLGARNRPTRVA